MDSSGYSFEGTRPSIHEDAHVSTAATVVGDVSIEADASVWPGAVLRGDVGPVTIGEAAHVGDGAIIHVAEVAEQAMIGHGAVLNDATVEPDALVGFNATVNSGATVGDGSIVASGCVIPPEFEVPPDSFARGVPAEVTPLADTTIDREALSAEYSSGEYTNLAARHEELFDC